MHLTDEQIAIVQSQGDIKINAVAGSGKTTTMIEYSRSRPGLARVLYLAFNRSVRLEAEHKFRSCGLHHVRVETAHSLACKYVVSRNGYKIRAQGYKTHEIADLLGLNGNGDKHAGFIAANHIMGLVSCFCNSDKDKPEEADYAGTLTDPQARAFVAHSGKHILSMAKILLQRMDKGEIEITHDFYLKKFQLSRPTLPFDYILFDEGQDASAAMMDIFLRQKATKVIVGDTHQQIYSWRYAINSLERTHFRTFGLSASFRFDDTIARLATDILVRKHPIVPQERPEIKGMGVPGEIKTRAVIARTNLGLLLRAIEFVTRGKQARPLYFEGNFNSYTYAAEGASLYDVLYLSQGKRNLIRDPLISSLRNVEELEDYIRKTDDNQLGMMLEIVKEYGNEIPGLLKTIRSRHVEDHEKQRAEVIFSTVHRCKGMEYDEVELVNDFMTEEKLKKLAEETEADGPAQGRLLEEVNLLYVAVTRAKSLLRIPEGLLPSGFVTGPSVVVLINRHDEGLQTDHPHSSRNTTLIQRGNRLIEVTELPPGERALLQKKKRTTATMLSPGLRPLKAS